jgi:hypothetical protein
VGQSGLIVADQENPAAGPPCNVLNSPDNLDTRNDLNLILDSLEP